MINKWNPGIKNRKRKQKKQDCRCAAHDIIKGINRKKKTEGGLKYHSDGQAQNKMA